MSGMSEAVFTEADTDVNSLTLCRFGKKTTPSFPRPPLLPARCSSLAPHSRALSLAPAPFPTNGPHCSHTAHLLHARHAPSHADRSAQTSMLTRRCVSLRISEKRFMLLWGSCTQTGAPSPRRRRRPGLGCPLRCSRSRSHAAAAVGGQRKRGPQHRAKARYVDFVYSAITGLGPWSGRDL